MRGFRREGISTWPLPHVSGIVYLRSSLKEPRTCVYTSYARPRAVQKELFGGLCYLKCSLLTNGTHPVRSSGWTCCRQEGQETWGSKGVAG